jgi:hypothetical protein
MPNLYLVPTPRNREEPKFNAQVVLLIPTRRGSVRGLNENTHGLIRQYFPKGCRFEAITDEQVEAVMHRLNYCPRKTLDYQTLHAVFLHTLNLKPHELWNCIYDLNPSFSPLVNDVFVVYHDLCQYRQWRHDYY